MKKFERLRHVRYFSNSLRNLPKQYSSADTTRITLVHFCVQALDILGCLPDHPDVCGNVEEQVYVAREEIIEWIYGLQTLPTLVASSSLDDGEIGGSSVSSVRYVGGGFKGGTYLGPLPNASDGNNDEEDDHNQQPPSSTEQSEQHPYDHSHIAMTYVAICTLLALGDDLSRIHKTAVLSTLKALQKEDGSFVAISSNTNRPTTNASSSEAAGDHHQPNLEDKVDDDCDLRFMYLAIVIWYLLDDRTNRNSDNKNDNESYINVESATSYILSCISYDGSIGLTPGREGHGGSTFCGTASLYLLGVLDDVMARQELKGWREDLIRWCVMRQKSLPKRNDKENENHCNGGYCYDCEKYAAGMQGRPNKLEDTCYSYWVGGTLHMLSESHLLDGWALREYVLTCQSPYGGFGKVVGANPDLLHSFYTLCWLAMSRDQGCCEEDYYTCDDGGEMMMRIADGKEDGRNNVGYNTVVRQQVRESINRLSQLDCALGICLKRVPAFRKTATRNGNH